MIPELHISKIEPSVYEARLSTGSSHDITEPTFHGTIAAALLHVGQDVPDDLAHFVDVHYGGGSLGTTALTRLASEPEAIADRLVALAAAIHQSEEELAHGRSTRASADSARKYRLGVGPRVR